MWASFGLTEEAPEDWFSSKEYKKELDKTRERANTVKHRALRGLKGSYQHKNKPERRLGSKEIRVKELHAARSRRERPVQGLTRKERGYLKEMTTQQPVTTIELLERHVPKFKRTGSLPQGQFVLTAQQIQDFMKRGKDYKRLISTLLVRGNIEENPGPFKPGQHPGKHTRSDKPEIRVTHKKPSLVDIFNTPSITTTSTPVVSGVEKATGDVKSMGLLPTPTIPQLSAEELTECEKWYRNTLSPENQVYFDSMPHFIGINDWFDKQNAAGQKARAEPIISGWFSAKSKFVELKMKTTPPPPTTTPPPISSTITTHTEMQSNGDYLTQVMEGGNVVNEFKTEAPHRVLRGYQLSPAEMRTLVASGYGDPNSITNVDFVDVPTVSDERLESDLGPKMHLADIEVATLTFTRLYPFFLFRWLYPILLLIRTQSLYGANPIRTLRVAAIQSVWLRRDIIFALIAFCGFWILRDVARWLWMATMLAPIVVTVEKLFSKNIWRKHTMFYVPHIVSCVLADAPMGCSREYLAATTRTKIRQLPTLPIPDREFESWISGTEMAIRACRDPEYFPGGAFCGPEYLRNYAEGLRKSMLQGSEEEKLDSRRSDLTIETTPNYGKTIRSRRKLKKLPFKQRCMRGARTSEGSRTDSEMELHRSASTAKTQIPLQMGSLSEPQDPPCGRTGDSLGSSADSPPPTFVETTDEVVSEF